MTPSAVTGLPSGFKDFDELTSGLHPADLVIIAGRPSMGKTTFAMNIIENVVIQQKKNSLSLQFRDACRWYCDAYALLFREH